MSIKSVAEKCTQPAQWPVKRGFIGRGNIYLLASDRMVYIFPLSAYQHFDKLVNLTTVPFDNFFICDRTLVPTTGTSHSAASNAAAQSTVHGHSAVEAESDLRVFMLVAIYLLAVVAVVVCACILYVDFCPVATNDKVPLNQLTKMTNNSSNTANNGVAASSTQQAQQGPPSYNPYIDSNVDSKSLLHAANQNNNNADFNENSISANNMRRTDTAAATVEVIANEPKDKPMDTSNNKRSGNKSKSTKKKKQKSPVSKSLKSAKKSSRRKKKESKSNKEDPRPVTAPLKIQSLDKEATRHSPKRPNDKRKESKKRTKSGKESRKSSKEPPSGTPKRRKQKKSDKESQSTNNRKSSNRTSKRAPKRTNGRK